MRKNQTLLVAGILLLARRPWPRARRYSKSRLSGLPPGRAARVK